MDGTTTTTTGGADGEQLTPGAPSGDETQILATAVGDQCASCGARLAPDQRYCVECGERRGRPRYSLPRSGTEMRMATAPSRWQGAPWSGSGALLAGVGLLLIALGVGVLIGRTSNNSNSSANSPLKVITVAGAAGAAPAATTPSTTGSAASRSAGSGTSRTTSSKAKKVTPKNAAAALAAKLPPKARVIPAKLKSAVVKPGQTCTSGQKGCTNGKFTGTFFGGGG